MNNSAPGDVGPPAQPVGAPPAPLVGEMNNSAPGDVVPPAQPVGAPPAPLVGEMNNSAPVDVGPPAQPVGALPSPLVGEMNNSAPGDVVPPAQPVGAPPAPLDVSAEALGPSEPLGINLPASDAPLQDPGNLQSGFQASSPGQSDGPIAAPLGVEPPTPPPPPSPPSPPRPPPPPPPPPLLPPLLPPAFAPDGADATLPYWDEGEIEIPPANITVVHTAEELLQAMENTALDVEIRKHLDLRTLNFTMAPMFSLIEGNCSTGYGSLTGSCAFMMYMDFARSLRGNCEGPPTAEEARQMNLPDSAVTSLQAVRPGQCLLIMDKSAFLTMRYNKWFDNLMFAITSEFLSPGAVTAVTATSTLTGPEHSPNTFFTRVSFQAMGGFLSAQAFAIPPNDPLRQIDVVASAVSRQDWTNHGHSILFQDCEFSGFRGANSPLLIASDSHAAFRNCKFHDMDLRVEVFDVSYGGSVHFDNCTLNDLEIRRVPPKYVSTTLNDDFTCRLPYTDMVKYHPEDDDYYDVEPEYIDPNDPSQGLYLDNATMSDCLRPIHYCQLDHQVFDAWPGCPPESVDARRFLNHNVCGYTPANPEDPAYYDNVDLGAYETYGERDDRYYADFPTGEVGFAQGPSSSPYPSYSDACRRRAFFDPFDPAGNLNSVGNVMHGFLTEDHPWLNTLKEILPANSREGEDSWTWPQVPYRNLQEGEAMMSSPPLQPPAKSSPCSGSCFTALFTVISLLICMLAAAALLLWRRRQRLKLTEKRSTIAVNADRTFTNPLARADAVVDWNTGPDSVKISQTRAKFHTATSKSAKNDDSTQATERTGWFALSAASRASFFGAKKSSGKSTSSRTLRVQSSGANRSWNQTVNQKSSLSSCKNEQYTYQLNPGLSLAASNQCSGLPNFTGDGVVGEGASQELRAGQGSLLPPQLAQWLQSKHISEQPPMHMWGSLKKDSMHSLDLKPPLHLTSTSQQPSISSDHTHVSRALQNEAVATSSTVQDTFMVGASTARETCSTDAYMAQQCEFVHVNPAAASLPSDKGAPVDTPVTVQSMGLSVKCTDAAASEVRMRHLSRQLDRFKPHHSFLGRFEMLGRSSRRQGGQAVVQFARRPSDGREFAVKFFVDSSSFYTEAALYTAYFPALHKQLKRPPAPCPWLLAPDSVNRVHPAHGAGGGVEGGRIAGARFLPHVEAVCDSAEGGLVDPRQQPLPPCIVMERGESLQEWSDRADPDRFTSFSVLANVSLRMKDMHEAGFVHRDLKPANVILLPRENRWTVIDFGCAARIGALAPLAFSLTYSPPEVITAAEARESHMEASPAVDVWALGVMAYELLTGTPAFRIVTDGIGKVLEGLRGEADLPWEGQLSEHVKRKLGALHQPILAMLSRDPDLRPSMKDVHESIIGLER